jgi:hypothetical protein
MVQRQIEKTEAYSRFTNQTMPVILYNQWDKLDNINKLTFFSLPIEFIDSKYTIHFSYNLFRDYIGTKQLNIIIKLDEYNYLIEHISTLNHYAYMKPIYYNRKMLINGFIFKKDHRLLDEKIFNFNLILLNKSVLEFGNLLLNIIPDTNTKNIILNQDQNIKICRLINNSNLDIFNVNVEVIKKIKRDGAYQHSSMNFLNINDTFYNQYIKNYYDNLTNSFTISENSYVKKKRTNEYRIKTIKLINYNINSETLRNTYLKID